MRTRVLALLRSFPSLPTPIWEFGSHGALELAVTAHMALIRDMNFSTSVGTAQSVRRFCGWQFRATAAFPGGSGKSH
jgi:hypothetical protein